MNYTNFYRKVINLHSYLPYALLNGIALPPLNIFFELTYRCNLRCLMCQFLPLVKVSNSLLKRDPDLELSLCEIKNIIKQVPKFALLTFTGGEPFIRKDILKILNFAAIKNRFHLITNGTLLNEKMASDLVKMGMKNIFGTGLAMIEFSVEGPESIHDKITTVHGSFNKTIKSISMINSLKNKIKSQFPLINIAVVITAENIKYLPQMILLAKELDVDILSFLTYSKFPHYNRLQDKIKINYSEKGSIDNNFDIDKSFFAEQIKNIYSNSIGSKLQIRFSPHGVPPENISDFYSEEPISDKFVCYSPWTKVFITSSGNVLLCPVKTVGNIRGQSLSAIWNNLRSKKFRRMLKMKGTFPECKGCCMLEHRRSKHGN